ncbi:MAG: histidine kinase [Oscillospiraceae bacterium]|jgi:sensor histidine kinase YesM|nr:histidine kinase [Oscillospiraceae bacterium]
MRKRRKANRLNVFIVLSIFAVTVLTTFMAGILFYVKSAETLTAIYSDELIRELDQINGNVRDQIAIVDSLFPTLVSSIPIYNNLEPAAEGYERKEPQERRLEIERQMSYILVNNFLWSENLLEGVYIFDSEGVCSVFSVYETHKAAAQTAVETADPAAVSVQIQTRGEDDDSIWFVKNIFSMYTGGKIAAIAVDINKSEWARVCSDGTDENWIILLYDEKITLLLENCASEDEIDAIKSAAKSRDGFQKISVLNTQYFMASHNIEASGLTSAVAASEGYFMRDLSEARVSFLSDYAPIALAAMVVTVLISFFITKPIKQMTDYVREVTTNKVAAKRPKVMFRELDEYVEAFVEMLNQLEIYYSDLREQQVLLKNAEIKALQAQMTPHFLFNVLNTIAWTAEIEGKSEIYRMVMSLSELLRANILSKDKDFVSLKEELDYARFYIYLQRQRFGEKFEAEIDGGGVAEETRVPRFCIQPLVENAILHGFEPLPDDGRDKRLKVTVTPENGGIRVLVEDNGEGFPDGFSLEDAAPVGEGAPLEESAHAGIGLRNLNRRLVLLLGAESGLSISSGGGKTSVTFVLPGNGGA